MQRLSALLAKVLRSNFEALPQPYKLTFAVTKECHSRCANCRVWEMKPVGELTLSEIERFAACSPFLSWIDFTGGEPTDRRDFAEIVTAFAKSCSGLFFVHFPTNGLKTKRIAEVCLALKDLRIPKIIVTVSIDGPPEVNDRLRGIPGDFDKAAETFSVLSKMKHLQVYAGLTLCESNAGLINETVDSLKTRIEGFTRTRLHVNLPHISAHFYANSGVKLKISEPMLKAMEDHRRSRYPLTPFAWLESMYQKRAREFAGSGRTRVHCAALLASVYLSESGVVYPCTIWDKPLGSIRESGYSLEPLLDAARRSGIRQTILDKQCPNCWTPCEAYQSILAGLLGARREWIP